MKIIFLLAVTMALHFGAQAQAGQRTGTPNGTLTVKESSFDFGKIPQGRPVSHEFEIINTGADSLRIDNVLATCGCTTPVWEKSAIAPKAHSKIQVGFNAAADGPFEKSIDVVYNGDQVRSFVIKGNVYRSATTSVPLNSSVQLLKQIK